MAQQRGRSGTLSGPHSVSLKVLRLSRPTLATQTTLPATEFGGGLDITPSAALAYPSADTSSSSFPLTPLLTLPAAFGAAYVGETFACTLCANNELAPDANKRVSAVKITAELQSSSNKEGLVLELEKAKDGNGEEEEGQREEEETGEIAPGGTIQRTLRHALKDEGPHVLAVTVTYIETAVGGTISTGRTRTFRKLYQFVAQQLIAVRSKITERKCRDQKAGQPRQWTLEAQLENVGEASVVVERVWLKAKDGIKSAAVDQPDGDNGDGASNREGVVLKPQDVEQVMFLVSEQNSATAEDDTAAGRTTLGQLNVQWRSAMGERGSLETGWLACRAR